MIARITYRYLSGRPLDGRAGHPYLSSGDGRWPGWKRQIARIVVPAMPVAAMVDPHATAAAAGAAGVVAVQRWRVRWRHRRFLREYVTPTLAAVQVPLGDAPVDLHVDPTLGDLTPRLAKPLSPAETKLRTVYGQRIEPVIRWPLNTTMRGLWAVRDAAQPATSKLGYFRRPGEKPGPRIELVAQVPYLTVEQRNLISAIVTSKIPVGDLVEHWDQVGARVKATWVVRRRPPAQVGLAEMQDVLPTLKEWEFYIGAGSGGDPVIASLDDDSPHILESAGSGAGKTVLAQTVAVQVLARGGLVTILDRKGSHRWAIGLPGVDYCTQPEQMHDALVKKAKLADQRNADAFLEDDDWDPGPRHLVICEEMNATIGQLGAYWDSVRQKGDPKRSPAVSALAELLFMGRSAKVNVLAIAQMLTARAIGGPEARENLGVRFLARYTKNNWKMLVPEAAMPRASRVRGRWQMVVGGVSTEVQVAFLTRAQARLVATESSRAAGLDKRFTSGFEQGQGQTAVLSLKEAIELGVIPWRYEAAKKRLQRAGSPPAPVGKRGWTDLFRRADLEAWVASERVS